MLPCNVVREQPIQLDPLLQIHVFRGQYKKGFNTDRILFGIINKY